MELKMDTKLAIQSQSLAALEMLKQVIVLCPAASWNAPGDKDKFWNKAYHALFYAHLYLQETEKHFTPWEKHHDPDTGAPFTQAEVLEYLAFVQKQVAELVPTLDLEAESGFDWLPFGKLELQFYNLRHIQQHTGELFERLDQQNIKLDWVGRQPTP
jgi:hypothetical protein